MDSSDYVYAGTYFHFALKTLCCVVFSIFILQPVAASTYGVTQSFNRQCNYISHSHTVLTVVCPTVSVCLSSAVDYLMHLMLTNQNNVLT